MGLRFLIVDGNERDVRESHRQAAGETMGQRYARVLMVLAPDVKCEICLVADAAPPSDMGTLGSFDAAFLTGSHLQLSSPTRSVHRQVDFAGALMAAGVPMFGSCWGLQVALTAAGGRIADASDGGEVMVARNIATTAAGRSHPMLAGRPTAYDALTLHFDRVAELPAGATVLARNGDAIQAVAFGPEQRCWGVQYHPELTLGHIAAGLERLIPDLVKRGYAGDRHSARVVVAELRTLDAAPDRRDLAWRYGLGDDILDERLRTVELRNFIAACVSR